MPGLHAGAILSRRHLHQIELRTEPTFVGIVRRSLIGQFFLASLREARPNLAFNGFPSVAAWQDTAASSSA
ncbi:hypothetical protein MKK67_03180, partial [Methylobacterium sp. J-072]|uniref:hypothetical protein n=1 Tax=Methylobacterium sp. J-072 TaxID=2836651 RepID=UPI001FBAEC42